MQVLKSGKPQQEQVLNLTAKHQEDGNKMNNKTIQTKLKHGRHLLSCLFFLFSLVPVMAQTASTMDKLLDSPVVSCAQASFFILQAGGETFDYISPEWAFEEAMQRGWLPRKLTSDEPASLGTVSLLIMRSFDLKGGLMYTLLHNPRYAARELVAKRIIRNRSDPARAVSGDRLLQILAGVLTYTGEEQALELAAEEQARNEQRQQTLEDVAASLREEADRQQGMSAGLEGIQTYDGGFDPE
jgi:hypothetical protein